MKTVEMMAAPTAMQPGGYILKAYADHSTAHTPQVELDYEHAVARGYRITLRWACARPMSKIDDNPALFTDACALLVPVREDSPWITMGDKGKPVQGVLWRADRDALWRMQAEGLGTMQRSTAPESWSVQASWDHGYWQVVLQLPGWVELEQAQRLGIAVWQGEDKERAGLKSVSTDWVGLERVP